jgi:hypothetical protein
MSKLYQDTEYPELVYLRPAPATRPVLTTEQIEQAGMVVDQAHAIAMYTSRSVPNVGPQGPPGHGFDTIIASCSDELTPITLGGPKTTFRCPYPLDMTNGFVRASLTTAPTGASMIVDVHMNGTTMFSTPISIDAGSRTSVGSTPQSVISIPLVGGLPIIPDDAEFLVYVNQVGSTFAGSGLKVAVTGEKADS